MKKKLLSSLLILVMLMSSVMVFAEDFLQVEKVQLVENLVEVSFSNGIFRNFEDSKKEVKVLEAGEEVKIGLEVKDDGKGKDKSKTFTIKIEELIEGKEYKLVIGKEFKANNGKTLENEYSQILKLEDKVKVEEKQVNEEQVNKEVEEKKEQEEKIVTPFVDIEGSKAGKQIARLYKKSLINGKTESEFKPNDEISLAEATSIIVRYLKLEDFTDIDGFKADAWYKEDVLKAIKSGVISLDEVNNLEKSVTLKDLSDILFNIKDKLEFKVETIEEGRTFVKGILSKNYDENTKIEGKKQLTRGDFATIFGNLIKK